MGNGDEVGMSIAYVVERYLFQIKEALHDRVIKTVRPVIDM